jgi:Putative beta-barrel porin-2, OmpL-like. bbp2
VAASGIIRWGAAAHILLGAALAAPRLLQAQAPPASKDSWLGQVHVDAFASASYTLNLNRPAGEANDFRVFDFDADRARLDVVELVVRKPAAAPGAFGFRLDLEAGQSIPRIEQASGLFRDPATGRSEHDYDIQQAFLSYVLPLGGGLRLDAGKFITSMGYEVIEGYDGYDDNASRSFLFGYAIPFTHTGLRLGYAVTPRLSAQLLVVQGWDDVQDDNSAKSIGAGLAWAPTSATSVALNGMVGPEQKSNNSNERAVLDGVATWRLRNGLGLGVHGDYGHETAALGPGRDAVWTGTAVYATYPVIRTFSLALRAERFDDRDGARTGVAQTLDEVTLTPSFSIGKHLVVRGDLRHDWSDHAVFQRRNGLTRQQTTISLNLLFVG